MLIKDTEFNWPDDYRPDAKSWMVILEAMQVTHPGVRCIRLTMEHAEGYSVTYEIDDALRKKQEREDEDL